MEVHSYLRLANGYQVQLPLLIGTVSSVESYEATHTVLLARHEGWEYLGYPVTGSVWVRPTVDAPAGRFPARFGDRGYWRAHVVSVFDQQLTEAGRAW